MPGFASEDQYLQATTTSGQIFKSFYSKLTNPTVAAVASEWQVMARGGGTPAAETLFNTGTNLAWQPVSQNTTNNSSIITGPAVESLGLYKYLVSGSSGSAAATTMPATMWLVDVLGFYRVTSTTTITAQTLTNSISSVTNTITSVDTGADTIEHTFYGLLTGTRIQLTTTTTLPAGLSLATDYFVIKVTDTTCRLATSYANAVAGTAIDITTAGTGTHTINTVLPRYTNGAGVQAIMFANNATPLGAGVPSLSLPNYTNSLQASGRATPTVLPIGKTAAGNNTILYSGTGAGKYNPWMPVQAPDAGIAQANSVQLSATYTSGEFSIALVYPVAEFNMTTVGILCERDFKNVMGGPPRIYDGASLYWLLGSGAATPANSAFFGSLTFAWN